MRLAALLIGALVLSAASAVSAAPTPEAHGAASGAAPEISPPCRHALDADWSTTAKAMGEKRYADADAAAERIAAKCQADGPVLATLTTVRADVAVRTAKARQAISLIEAAPPSETNPVWVYNRFVYLAALKATGDDPRFMAERDRLVSANDARMLAGDDWMKQERFETPAAVVDAYRRRTRKGDPNDTLFIATPKTPLMPASYQVNEGGLGGLISALNGKPDERDELGDLNQCEMHASLAPVRANYASWRAEAVKLFSDPKTFSASAMSDQLCPGWTFIFPALVPAGAGDGK